MRCDSVVMISKSGLLLASYPIDIQVKMQHKDVVAGFLSTFRLLSREIFGSPIQVFRCLSGRQFIARSAGSFWFLVECPCLDDGAQILKWLIKTFRATNGTTFLRPHEMARTEDFERFQLALAEYLPQFNQSPANGGDTLAL